MARRLRWRCADADGGRQWGPACLAGTSPRRDCRLTVLFPFFGRGAGGVGMPAERSVRGVSFLVRGWLLEGASSDGWTIRLHWLRTSAMPTLMAAQRVARDAWLALARIHLAGQRAEADAGPAEAGWKARLEEALAAMDWRGITGDGTSANALSPGAPGRSDSRGGLLALGLVAGLVRMDSPDDARGGRTQARHYHSFRACRETKSRRAPGRWRRRLWPVKRGRRRPAWSGAPGDGVDDALAPPAGRCQVLGPGEGFGGRDGKVSSKTMRRGWMGVASLAAPHRST